VLRHDDAGLFSLQLLRFGELAAQELDVSPRTQAAVCSQQTHPIEKHEQIENVDVFERARGAVLCLGLLYFGDKSCERGVEFAPQYPVRRLLVVDAGHQRTIRLGEGFERGKHIGIGRIVMRDTEFRECEGKGGHHLLVQVDRIARKFHVEERRVGRERTRVFLFVAVRGDQIGAIDRAVDGDFALFSATDGADFFAFGGTESFRFSLFADRAGHVEQNTLWDTKFKKLRMS